jgi:hypothetical protein
MSDIDKSNIDPMYWAQQLVKSSVDNDFVIDEEILLGWFANYRFAVADPLQAKIERLNNLLIRSRDCLRNSIDDVHNAYITDYRHESPYRSGQLQDMQDELERHRGLLGELNNLFPDEEGK